MRDRDISWCGRIFIDEERITPQEYKEFFDRGEFVISFDVANCILKNRMEGYKEEVVPADQLFDAARELIKEQVFETREPSGNISMEGQTLSYDWEYDIYIDGENATIEELEDWELAKILVQMLDDGYHAGMW